MCYSYACRDMYNPQLTGSIFFSHPMGPKFIDFMIFDSKSTTHSENAQQPRHVNFTAGRRESRAVFFTHPWILDVLKMTGNFWLKICYDFSTYF